MTDPGTKIDGATYNREPSIQAENGGAENGATSGTDGCAMSQKEQLDADPVSVRDEAEPESAYDTLLDDISVDVQQLSTRGAERKERRFKRLKRGDLEVKEEGEGVVK